MKTLLFLTLLFGHNVFAQVIVQTLDPELDAGSFKSEGVEVHEGIDPSLIDPPTLPDLKKRDDDFRKAGLVSEIASLDQLDRDILYREATRLSLAEFTLKYKAIPPQKLGALKALVGGRK